MFKNSWIRFKFWPNFGEEAPRGCLVCGEKERLESTAGERLEGLSKFIYRVMLEFGCESL